ncbi:MAG: class II glutamine amidotransferase [Eubacteriales bacterium]|nr:class II glutamine amidotransferase [Eubacteriales bacterium]
MLTEALSLDPTREGASGMCELYGFSGSKARELNEELREFYSHSTTNPDGWGLAYFNESGRFIDKSPKPAYKSAKLDAILNEPIESASAIAHIRYATVGYEEYDNAHPFWGEDASGRTWVFAHNGTIFEGDVLNSYFYRQKGTTDSERVFLYMLDRLNYAIKLKGAPLSPEERFAVIEELVEELAPENKLNLLIYDGELLYVHSNERGTLHRRISEGGYTFSTKPLTEGDWQQVPFMTLTAYRDGRQVMEGKCHGYEFVMDEKKMNEIFMAYSEL